MGEGGDFSSSKLLCISFQKFLEMFRGNFGMLSLNRNRQKFENFELRLKISVRISAVLLRTVLVFLAISLRLTFRRATPGLVPTFSTRSIGLMHFENFHHFFGASRNPKFYSLKSRYFFGLARLFRFCFRLKCGRTRARVFSPGAL